MRPGLSSIKLQLYNHCYFNNLASFIIEDETITINCITIDDQLLRNNLLIDNNHTYHVNSIDNNLSIANTRIELDNIANQEIFPFVWIRGDIDDSDENILYGSSVMKINLRTNEEQFVLV